MLGRKKKKEMYSKVEIPDSTEQDPEVEEVEEVVPETSAIKRAVNQPAQSQPKVQIKEVEVPVFLNNDEMLRHIYVMVREMYKEFKEEQ